MRLMEGGDLGMELRDEGKSGKRVKGKGKGMGNGRIGMGGGRIV